MSVNKVNKTTGELVTLANGTRMWIGTKTAHDLAVQQGTMPNNCMVCITDDAAGEDAWKYSTEETNTGKTWIDGKPIYRKVFHYDTVSVDGDYKVLDNVDTLINQGGCQTYANFERFQFPWIFYNKGNDEVERLCFVVKSNGLYRRINYNQFNNLSAFNWWVEYTKTTD